MVNVPAVWLKDTLLPNLWARVKPAFLFCIHMSLKKEVEKSMAKNNRKGQAKIWTTHAIKKMR